MSLFFHMSLFFFMQDLHLRLPPPDRPAEKDTCLVSQDPRPVSVTISAGIIY